MAKIAIVTGASSGIGREFAHQLAERPEVEEVWALARGEEKLQLLASDGMLVKRPILVFGDGEKVLTGFKEAEWAAGLE